MKDFDVLLELSLSVYQREISRETPLAIGARFNILTTFGQLIS